MRIRGAAMEGFEFTEKTECQFYCIQPEAVRDLQVVTGVGDRDERRSSTSKRIREAEADAFVPCRGIGLETGYAAQYSIGLYRGDAKLRSESLDCALRTATQILNAIGADESSAPPT